MLVRYQNHSSFYFLFIYNYLIKYCVAAFTQFTGCDYFQSLTPGQTYDVFSPGYLANQFYPSGTNCRWRVVAPVYDRIRINCFDMRLPQVNWDKESFSKRNLNVFNYIRRTIATIDWKYHGQAYIMIRVLPTHVHLKHLLIQQGIRSL